MSGDWKIPSKLQPSPTDYGFDLDRALSSVVAVKTAIPDDAFTASILGTERAGSGAVISADSLVLTMGYLVTEAETVWLTTTSGRTLPGHVLAVDSETGFALVQPLGRLDVPHLERGDSRKLTTGDEVLLAAAGGRAHTVATGVVIRQQFAGYWEYLLDNAIFTAPAHPMWGGAALIDSEGGLPASARSFCNRPTMAAAGSIRNMVVPIDLLEPILDPMLQTGTTGRPPRPWAGFYAVEDEDGGIVVGGVAERGPAARAGMQTGDLVTDLDGHAVNDLAGLWRALWQAGPPGTRVTLRLRRDGDLAVCRLDTIDRTSLLRAPKLH